jgi:cobalt/nickel transport system permease protein
MKNPDWNRTGSGENPVHRKSAALKAGLAFGAIAIISVTPSQTALVVPGIAVLLCGVMIFGRLPILPILGRLALIEPFLIAVAALALIQPGGSARFIHLLARSTMSLAVLIVLTATTSFPDLLALSRRLRVPTILITMAALLYRYVFVLGEEMQRMKRARRSRTFRKGRGRTWHSLSMAVGALFLRTTERSERIYRAMTARGWK